MKIEDYKVREVCAVFVLAAEDKELVTLVQSGGMA
jgi:hypothetical protein